MAAPADAERTAAVRGDGSPPSTWPEVLALIFLLASGFQLEPRSTELLAQEERFSEILKEYELKCRVSGLLPEGKSCAVCSGLGGPSQLLAFTWGVAQPGSAGASLHELGGRSF